MNESNKFTSIYKNAEDDLYERGNFYKKNETARGTIREIRICTPDHFKYEYKKLKEQRQQVANEEKKKYKVESENLKNRLKNCYNYHDLFQYFMKQNNNFKKVKLNLINEMTYDIFHTKATIDVDPKFHQLNDELTQYIHDYESIENKEIDDEKHLEFIQGLSKTYDQSIKKITKADIKRIYETGTVVSMAKRRTKFFNEDKEDKLLNRSILEAINNMNKELQELDMKDGLALSEGAAQQRELLITNAMKNSGNKNKFNEKKKGKERVRRMSMERRRSSVSSTGADAAAAIKMNEQLLKNNQNRRISITQIKQGYDEVKSYVRRQNGFMPPLLNKRATIRSGNCIMEGFGIPRVDEFGNLTSKYISKKPVLNFLYPDERAIITKSKNLRTAVDNSFIFQLIRPYKAFKKYSTFMLKEICKIITFKIFKRNHIIYSKGDVVGSWYVILEGAVGIYGMNKNEVVPLVTFLEDEDISKISLYTESPQDYTVKVLSDVILIACIEKEDFLHIMQWMFKYDLMLYQNFFKSIPDFENVTDTVIERMSNICHTVKFTAGSTVIKEKEFLKYIYFIQSGTCEVFTSIEVDINQEMKNIIAKYSGYGSRYDMPKYTDPYGKLIIRDSMEELKSDSEEEIDSNSDYCSISSHGSEVVRKSRKQKEEEFLNNIIPTDIRVKQVFLGELSKNEYFGEGAVVELHRCQRYSSPVTVKCKTDVTVNVINIFDLIGLLPDFFKTSKYFNISKDDAKAIYYKQKEEDLWIKIKEKELSGVLKEQSGDCLKKYSLEREKIF